MHETSFAFLLFNHLGWAVWGALCLLSSGGWCCRRVPSVHSLVLDTRRELRRAGTGQEAQTEACFFCLCPYGSPCISTAFLFTTNQCSILWPYSSSLSIAVINTMIKRNLRKEGFISAYNSHITVHHWGKPRQKFKVEASVQKLKQRLWRSTA